MHRIHRRRAPRAAALVLPFLLLAPMAHAGDVVLRTDLGDIEIDLFEEEAPLTVANFLAYLEAGEYEQSVIHRSVGGFVIQGGGYRVSYEDEPEGEILAVETFDPVPNEPGISNTRGTIAMAKISGQPNSATSQWYINVGDNTSLDTEEEGYTVFGEVVGDGMDVVDAINALPRYNLGGAFSSTPLRNYTYPESATLDNLVLLDVESVSDFTINPGLNDAWYNPETNGQGMFFTVYPDGGTFFLSWFTFDVQRPADGVTATVGEPGHRWITAQGTFKGNTATLTAYLSSGGVFDAAQPAPGTASYGTVTVTFEGCNSARVVYDFPDAGVSGEVTVQRVVTDNVPLCEALLEAAVTQ